MNQSLEYESAKRRSAELNQTRSDVAEFRMANNSAEVGIPTMILGWFCAVLTGSSIISILFAISSIFNGEPSLTGYISDAIRITYVGFLLIAPVGLLMTSVPAALARSCLGRRAISKEAGLISGLIFGFALMLILGSLFDTPGGTTTGGSLVFLLAGPLGGLAWAMIEQGARSNK